MRIEAENTASVAAETVEAKAQLQVALARIVELEAELKKENQSALIKQLREIGDFAASHGWGRDTIYFRAADRIAELEAALRNLDDMIVDLDAGHMELHQVSRVINAALAGGKKDG